MSITKRDFLYLGILVLLSAIIGALFISTAVLITDDGVVHIHNAQKWENAPREIFTSKSPGYSFILYLNHQFLSLFGFDDWIVSSQIATLLCRTLCVIPLYFIGRLFVGPFSSFLGMLIFLTLPYPAEMGADVIREWPYLLFFSTGLLFLLLGSDHGKWFFFLFAGAASGLAYLIRPEGALLVVICVLWLMVRMFQNQPFGRGKLILLGAAVMIGFLASAGPHLVTAQKKLPDKLDKLLAATPSNGPVKEIQTAGIDGSIMAAGIEITSRLFQDLNGFFIFPWILGIWAGIKDKKLPGTGKSFFVYAILLFYTAMLLALLLKWGYMSRRHCLPMITVSFFYIPVGIGMMARFFTRKSHPDDFFGLRRDSRTCWLVVLLVIGFGINFGKFVSIFPMRADKQDFKTIAQWLKTNTKPSDVIAYADLNARIRLYANRTMVRIQPWTSTLKTNQINTGHRLHVTAVYDGAYQRIYVNGEPVSSKRLSFTKLSLGQNNLALGKAYAGSSQSFQGTLDHAVLFGRALGFDEIKALYRTGIGAVDRQEMIGYWPLDDAAEKDRGMTFDGESDFIDLSKTASVSEALTVALWVRSSPEIAHNWMMGRGRQFRIGIHKGQILFWIMEASPGSRINDQADYLILPDNAPKEMFEELNQITLQAVVPLSYKTGRIVIYKIIRTGQP